MQADPKTTQLRGWGIAILRVVTGYLFLASGAHKLFLEDLGQAGSTLPVSVVVVSSIGELICGTALIVGLFTRLASIPLAILMLADIVVIHPPYGFFAQDPAYEYATIRLAACVALALTGSNKAALGNILNVRRRPK